MNSDDMQKCDACGQQFNRANLDEVMFHAGNHTPVVATGIVGQKVEEPPAHREELSSTEHMNRAHRTSMTQHQRKELVRILSMVFEGEEKLFTFEQLANMNDRQISLTWLRMCDYISEGEYQREFEACEGRPLFTKS